MIEKKFEDERFLSMKSRTDNSRALDQSSVVCDNAGAWRLLQPLLAAQEEFDLSNDSNDSESSNSPRDIFETDGRLMQQLATINPAALSSDLSAERKKTLVMDWILLRNGAHIDSAYIDPLVVMLHYKTLPCPKTRSVCRKSRMLCPGYHRGDYDKRRNPAVFSYKSKPCPSIKQRDSDKWGNPKACTAGDGCGYCHTQYEQQFHPSVYKRELCQDIHRECPRSIFCAFSHDENFSDLNKLQERWSLVKKVDTERPSTPMLNPPAEKTLMTVMQRDLSNRQSMTRASSESDDGRSPTHLWPWSHPAWMHMSDPFVSNRRGSIDSGVSTSSDCSCSDDLEVVTPMSESVGSNSSSTSGSGSGSGFFISADGHCIVNGEPIEAWQLVPADEA